MGPTLFIFIAFQGNYLLLSELVFHGMDDTAKGGLTEFENTTVIPCAVKDFKR